MFRKTTSELQGNLCSSSSMLMMSKREQRQFDDPRAWHNEYYNNVTSLIDEEMFSVLFKDSSKGAPNASVRRLVAMCWLKDGLCLSDERFFEACGYNLLVHRALGLENLNESYHPLIPIISSVAVWWNGMSNTMRTCLRSVI